MPCFYPLPATLLPGGGKPVVHHRTPGLTTTPTPSHLGRDIKLPCGRCHGCRLDRSKQWAIRLMNEAQQHEKSCFLTLTYSDETLARRRPAWEPTVPYAPPSRSATPEDSEYPEGPRKLRRNGDSLRPRDVQLFMKRLRKDLTTRGSSAKVRFYLVGEYGDLYGRPHYHVALFGEDFSDDRVQWRTSGEYRCHRSSRLERLWTLGNSEIGELTIESAAYIARYVMKKINGKKADDHYRRTDENGQDYWLVPEFAHMSRRPGIGKAWFEEYQADVYPHDYVVIDGRKLKPPRYYDKLLEQFDPVQMEVVKMMREHRAKDLAEDNTPARLMDKEAVSIARMKLKKRNLE